MVYKNDVHDGYIIEKIWLKELAMPTIAISNIAYTPNVALAAGTPTGDPSKIRAILGMEKKRPFVIVRIPAFAPGSSAGLGNAVTSFKLDVTEQPVPAARAAAKVTDVSASVLSSGTWFKIGVTQTGFYKLDVNFINSLGVSASTIDPANIRIFGNGAHMLAEANSVARPSDLQENALLVNDGGDHSFNGSDNVIFYAQGPMAWDKDSADQRFVHLKNLYTDTAYYFITFDHGAGARIAQLPAVGGANTTVTDYNYYDVHDSDAINPPNLGKIWYGETFSPLLSNTTQTFSFNFGTTVSNVYTTVQMGSTSATGGSQMLAYMNGQQLGSSVAYSATGVDDVMSLGATSGTVAGSGSTGTVTVQFVASGSTSLGYLDYIEINARRPLAMMGDQMCFRDWQSVGSGNVANYNLQGAGASTQVWDVTDPRNPVVMSGTLSGSTYSFAQDAGMLHEFAVMNGGSFFAPKFIGQVTNQNLHGLAQNDCIIITPKEFLDQATQLAGYHTSHDNMRVVVATTEQIYNEFSSGGQDVSAIRDFVRMFYKRAGTDTTQMPRYLILFGSASYDYKNRVANNCNKVPVFESANSVSDITGFSSDDFFGFLDDNENIEDPTQLNVLDIGIGRLPARKSADAQVLVNKILSYKQSATLGSWRLNGMFVADNADGAGNHLADAEDMAATVTGCSDNLYNERKVYLDAIPFVNTPAGDRCPNANAAIDDQIFKGTFLVNYNGHGNTQVWADERILTQDDFNTWNNANMLPFMVTATCDFGQFDHPQYVSAAEQLALRNGGGVITVLTTTAPVYASYNHELNVNYLTVQFLRNADYSWNSFGDAVRMGKNVTYSTTVFSDKLGNFRKFALLGDPALVPNFPEYEVKLDSVTDDAVHGLADTLKALGAYTLHGSVRDHNGNLLGSFNGDASVAFYDKARTISTITTPTQKFQLQDNLVYRGKATVTNGTFSMSFITPKDITYYMGAGKMSAYAQNGITDAAGMDTTITVGGFSDHPVVSTTPPVVRPFINDSLFLNGGITGNNTSLFAILTSETGINVAGSYLGHDLVGILDGDVETPYVLNDYYETEANTYKRGYVSYLLSGLADGKHTMKVRAWDVNDNVGEGSVDFYVVDGKVVDIQNLGNYPNPFNGTTHFVFEHNHPNEPLSVDIHIYNMAGQLARKISASFTPEGSRTDDIEWDGTDNNGVKLPSGVYVYRLTIATEKGYHSSAYQKLVIVR